MQDTMNMKKCIASIALFNEFSNQGKDIYAVLAEFIKTVIVEKKKHQFSSIEIVNILKDSYGFEIPEGVVRNSLKRIEEIERKDKKYFVKTKFETSYNLTAQTKDELKNNNDFLVKIRQYIEERKKRVLYKNEIELVSIAFCDFMLDDKYLCNEYSKYISSYIIQNEADMGFIQKLDNIRQGVLLYYALQYNPEDFSKNTWETELSLFLDTEILFSICGYNGPLFQQMANELLDLIKEVNSKSKKKGGLIVIELQYFDEVKNEIDNYFHAAEISLRKKEREFQRKDAMIAILNGCSDPTDVIEKKALFFKKLEYEGISIDSRQGYYRKEDIFYNIESKDVIDKIYKNFEGKYNKFDIEYCLKLLSKVNQLRKDNNRNTGNVKYYLLTGNSMYMNIANCDIIRNREYPVSLTISIERLSEMLWIKLNKGFSKIKLINFDVITRSQLVIENQIHVSFTEKYNELMKRYSDKKINESEANAILVELKKYRAIKGNVKDTNIEDVMRFSEDSIDKYMETQEFLKQTSEQTMAENADLKKTLDHIGDELNKYREIERVKKEKHTRQMKIWNLIKWISISVLLLVSMIYAIIYRSNPIISIILALLALSSSFVGILRFCGYDLEKIKLLIKPK